MEQGDDNTTEVFDVLPAIPDTYLDEHDYGPKVPYQRIHQKATSFSEKNHFNVWITGVTVSVKVSLDKRPSHRINSNLYKVDLVHEEHHWTIYRRYKHFRSLHEQLMLFLAGLRLPVPTKQHREKKKSFRGEKSTLPRFPLIPDQFIREENIPLRTKQLEEYLQCALKCRMYRNHIEMLKFLEISRLSFIKELGCKRKEGMVMKSPGGRSTSCLNCKNMFQLGRTWHKRWFIIKDTFLTFLRPHDGAVRDVILLDSDFDIKSGYFETGVPHGILIKNSCRELLFSCWTHRKQVEWSDQIKMIADGTGKEYTEEKRFNSFAPIRTDAHGTWFVDGDLYFESVADVLEAATEEIFITDWWLSPELYLKRSGADFNQWRLDVVLKRKAECGVKVFILLYKEIALALGINSYYSKRTLMSLHHENIKVLRHPDHVPGGVYLWAHHEKLVVVDQKSAFLGGFDLCYGRWDCQNHRLDDLGSIVNAKDDQNLSIVVENKDENSSQENTSSTSLLTNSLENEATVSSSSRKEEDPVTVIAQLQPGYGEDTVDSADQEPSETISLPFIDIGTCSAATTVENKKPVEIHGSGDAKKGAVRGAHKHDHLWKETSVNKIVSNHDQKSAFGRSVSMKTNFLNDTVDKGGDARKYMRHVSLMDYPSKDLYENILERYNCLEKTQLISSARDSESQSGNYDSIGHTNFSGSTQVDKSLNARRRWRRYRNVVKLITVENVNVTVKNIPGLDEMSSNMKPSTPKSKRRFMPSYISDRLPAKQESTETKESSNDDSISESPPASLHGASKLWIGKDYCNFIFKDFVDLEAPFEDMIDRTKTPRMPWHDIGIAVYGSAAQDVARHFIQRWNMIKVKKVRDDEQYPFLFPKIIPNLSNPATAGKLKIQILRSVGQWSAGNVKCENSIQQAYVKSIKNAKHFIYIENQFFISKVATDNIVLNKINKALFERILKAHRKKETFRVYIVMPLLPAFEGEIGTKKGTAIQAITHWNYASICRGNESLLTRLKQEGVTDPFNYVTFYGLRNHGELLEKLTTELVYVHSKMMIVDDDTTIIGSANINDRSMLGDRDSEMAVIIQDLETVPVQFNGKDHKAGHFSSSLRKTVFKEHLGLEDDELLVDPVCDAFYKEIWIQQASFNTTIYEKVFNCIPNDGILTFDELKKYNKKSTLAEDNPGKAREMLKNVHGHLVLIPLYFLSNENLTPPPGAKEALLPTVLWT
ncbi:phospholipase D1-like [Octopus sinensis]|uniref:Phospholipase n=1 Tax=Octopus sinensis TaxID=2607531 RepID=A0A6P7TJ27_9MOLL|nr:phospholipase D1-like [Octopus sinensis]